MEKYRISKNENKDIISLMEFLTILRPDIEVTEFHKKIYSMLLEEVLIKGFPTQMRAFHLCRVWGCNIDESVLYYKDPEPKLSNNKGKQYGINYFNKKSN